ncbi:hypothetical protein PS2_033773 [Malus domestica]
MFETFENVKFEKVPCGGSNQLHWKSRKKVERANNKTEGEGDHVPQNPHLGKYQILRRAQSQFFFGTISPEGRILSLLLVDTLCEVLEQMLNFGMAQEERLSELMLSEEAQV